MSRFGPDAGKVIQLPEEHDLQLSALYHQSDAPHPPAGLEQRILAAARDAAVETVQRKRSLARRRVPLPLAAALLVVTGLAPLLLWHDYQGGFARHADAPAQTVDAEPAPFVPADAGPEPVSQEAPEPAETPAPETLELRAIEALIESGRDAEAWEHFSAFRVRYPDQRIPDELLDRLAGVRLRLLEAAGGG